MRCKLAAVGPSLVDINIKLADSDFARLCEVYSLRAGDWREIKHRQDFDRLLNTIGIHDFEALLTKKRDGLSVVAGSSTLSMLAAQPRSLRRGCLYISVVAVQGQALTPLSRFFIDAVGRMDIRHLHRPVEGENPMGLVVAAISHPEKLLFFHPGVARSSGAIDLADLECDLLIIDVYELQGGDLTELLLRTIESGRHRIALSLGNHMALNGKALQRIRGHILEDRISVIAGNRDEYQALMPEVADCYLSKSGFGMHPIAQHTSHSLLTLGAAGMIANWDGQTFAVEAAPLGPNAFINTSGAGDTAAGTFFSGIVEGASVALTLNKAARMARAVLQVPSSMVIG
jgi:sugar/nucleoside kinase (ribokinase family)